METSLKILFVPRWYPSRLDHMPGLFIRRQAEALAKKNEVRVISVHPDPDAVEKYEVVHTVENSVRVCRVYYRPCSGFPLLSRLLGFIRYVRAHHMGYMSQVPFSVDIVHGHIFTREIFFTWYMARKQKRPYVISEHWSRYFQGNLTYKGWLRKCMSRWLLKRSSGLIAVSEPLLKAMRGVHLEHPMSWVVPNVVDVSAYIPSIKKPENSKAVILHVSCFENKSKNISGFLEALTELYKHRNDFIVQMIGEGPDYLALQQYAGELGLRYPQLEFKGLKENAELIELYQSASFLVQSSYYETFGTVVVEALSCGLPVVSTGTGIAPGIIGKGNGIIIEQPHVDEIVKGIKEMLDIYSNFDRNKLHESVAGEFSGDSISEQLAVIYLEILRKWQKD